MEQLKFMGGHERPINLCSKRNISVIEINKNVAYGKTDPI